MIRIGIVGAGNIAHKFAKDIQVVEGASITAVASRSREKAQAFALEYGIPHAIESYEAMATSGLVDAVYIATPHNFHLEQSILYLSHNIHVLCEKPISVNAKEFEQMAQVAKQHNVLLMEAMWTRFLPAMKSLNRLIDSGELGDLLQLDVRFGFPISDHASANGRLLNPNLAGGSLLDLGVYCCTMFRMTTSDPIRSMASSALMAKTGVDLMTVVDIVLDNPQQTTVHLECAQDRKLSNLATLQFEHATIELPDFWAGTSLVLNGHTEGYPHEVGGFEYEIQAFVDAIESGLLEEPIMTHAVSLEIMQLMDDIRAQIKLRYPFE